MRQEEVYNDCMMGFFQKQNSGSEKIDLKINLHVTCTCYRKNSNTVNLKYLIKINKWIKEYINEWKKKNVH